MQNQFFHTIYQRAVKEGQEAVQKLIESKTLQPMIVQERASPVDDSSEIVKEYFVEDGVCGFAWIVIKPATSAFAKWLVKNDIASPHWQGGISIWVHEYDQSMQKKSAFARGFAKVIKDNLEELKLKSVSSGSRMD